MISSNNMNLKRKPLVLITNDDGINSPGLHALAEAIIPFAELLIAAPRVQQTGMGRGALNGDKIGSIQRKNLVINGQIVQAYAINGSPSQSVAHAILELTERRPDYCLSGINYGENLGLSFTCSGTLGAAFEADSQGIPSIAFSRSIPFDHQKSNDFNRINWEMEKYHVERIFMDIVNHGMPEKVRILNVNFPIGINESTDVRVTRQAYMNYGEYVQPGKRDFSLGHQLKWKLNHQLHMAQQDTDIYAVHYDKVISVTPMTSLMWVNARKYHG